MLLLPGCSRKSAPEQPTAAGSVSGFAAAERRQPGPLANTAVAANAPNEQQAGPTISIEGPTAGPVAARVPVELKGTVTFRDPVKRGEVVIHLPGSAARERLDKDENGRYTFNVKLRAPSKPGRHAAEIKIYGELAEPREDPFVEATINHAIEVVETDESRELERKAEQRRREVIEKRRRQRAESSTP